MIRAYWSVPSLVLLSCVCAYSSQHFSCCKASLPRLAVAFLGWPYGWTPWVRLFTSTSREAWNRRWFGRLAGEVLPADRLVHVLSKPIYFRAKTLLSAGDVTVERRHSKLMFADFSLFKILHSRALTRQILAKKYPTSQLMSKQTNTKMQKSNF